MSKSVKKPVKPAAKAPIHHVTPAPVTGVVEQHDRLRYVIQTAVLPFIAATVITTVLTSLAFSTFHRSAVPVTSQAQKGPVMVLPMLAGRRELSQAVDVVRTLYIDPMMVIRLIDSHGTDVAIVDIRPSAEFGKEHIKTAINLPFVAGEPKLSTQWETYLSTHRGSKVILYGATAESDDTLALASLLLKRGAVVRILHIGWNEWRHFSTLWIPESQWGTIDINNYIQTSTS